MPCCPPSHASPRCDPLSPSRGHARPRAGIVHPHQSCHTTAFPCAVSCMQVGRWCNTAGADLDFDANGAMLPDFVLEGLDLQLLRSHVLLGLLHLNLAPSDGLREQRRTSGRRFARLPAQAEKREQPGDTQDTAECMHRKRNSTARRFVSTAACRSSSVSSRWTICANRDRDRYRELRFSGLAAGREIASGTSGREPSRTRVSGLAAGGATELSTEPLEANLEVLSTAVCPRC